MTLNARQLDIASQIDARMCELERVGTDEATIFVKMRDLMPGFKRLMEIAGHDGMDEMCARFGGFYRYARILENIAGGIQSGEIKVPRE